MEDNNYNHHYHNNSSSISSNPFDQPTRTQSQSFYQGDRPLRNGVRSRQNGQGGGHAFGHVAPDGTLTLTSQQLDLVKSILITESSERSTEEVRQLIPLFKNIKFFKGEGDDMMPEIVQRLTYEYFPRGKEVFEYGSIGEKFYIIIDGEVSIMVPNPDCRDFQRRHEEIIEERRWKKEMQEQGKAIEAQIALAMKRKLKAEEQALASEKQKTIQHEKKQSTRAEIQLSPLATIQRRGPKESLSLDVDDQEEEEEIKLDNPDNLDSQGVLNLEKKKLEDLLKRQQTIKEAQFITVRKASKNVPMFIEFTKLQGGKAFGEQALLKNNEPQLRAATIKCTKDCHFAVMSKEDFQSILKNKLKKAKLYQIEVLQKLPIFQVWTKTQLLKLVTFIIEPKQFIRNQIVYREGDKSDCIYIIRSGDFEVSRKYQRAQDYSLPEKDQGLKNQLFDSLGSPNSGAPKKQSIPAQLQGQATKINFFAKQNRNIQTFKLALLGPGQIFGDDDVLFDRPYSSSIVCRSNTGVLIQMNGPELLKKMRANEECWKLYQSYIAAKENTVRLRLHKIDHVFHKEHLPVGGKGPKKGSETKQQYPSLVLKKLDEKQGNSQRSPANDTYRDKYQDKSHRHVKENGYLQQPMLIQETAQKTLIAADSRSLQQNHTQQEQSTTSFRLNRTNQDSLDEIIMNKNNESAGQIEDRGSFVLNQGQRQEEGQSAKQTQSSFLQQIANRSSYQQTFLGRRLLHHQPLRQQISCVKAGLGSSQQDYSTHIHTMFSMNSRNRTRNSGVAGITLYNQQQVRTNWIPARFSQQQQYQVDCRVGYSQSKHYRSVAHTLKPASSTRWLAKDRRKNGLDQSFIMDQNKSYQGYHEANEVGRRQHPLANRSQDGTDWNNNKSFYQ